MDRSISPSMTVARTDSFHTIDQNYARRSVMVYGRIIDDKTLRDVQIELLRMQRNREIVREMQDFTRIKPLLEASSWLETKLQDIMGDADRRVFSMLWGLLLEILKWG